MAWSAAFAAMASVHMLIGIGEGLISALVFLGIRQVRPDLTADISGAASTRGWSESLGYGLPAALGIAIFVAPFACPWPDGLESVAARLGFEHKTIQPIFQALAPDYAVPGLHWAVGATALAGALGTLVVFGLALLLARSLVRKPEQHTHPTRP